MMAGSFSGSSSESHSRLDLLATQVRVLLRRSVYASASTLDIAEKGLTNQWLSRFFLTGKGQDGKCWIQVVLVINWVTHELAVERGYGTISVDPSWENKTSPEVDEAVRLFCKDRDQWKLRPACSFGYARNVDEAFVDRELGLRNAQPLVWAGEFQERTFTVEELAELKVVIRRVPHSNA